MNQQANVKLGVGAEPALEKRQVRGIGTVSLLTLLLVVVFPCTSCRSTRHLSAVDLSAPGWHLQAGEAVWRPAKSKAELAGELLLATHASGDFFVQFTKMPFSLVVAQSVAGQWQIEFGNSDYVCRGRGKPPMRFAWFQLPRALTGTSLSNDWRIGCTATNFWKLENTRTGETLEGYLSP